MIRIDVWRHPSAPGLGHNVEFDENDQVVEPLKQIESLLRFAGFEKVETLQIPEEGWNA